MKKLLLVLMVVAMASFLLVGCLPGTTPPAEDEGEGEGEEEVVQAVTIEIEDQYPADVKEYIRAGLLDVTVTFAEAIPADKSVTFQAKQAWVPTPKVGAVEILTEVAGSGRKEWKFVNYDFANTGADPLGLGDLEDCAEICLYVTVADCCDATLNEVYTEVVKLDNTDPCADFELTFTDCGPCVEKPGVYMSFTSVMSGTCADVDVCEDCCSGVGDWTFTVIPPATECDTACDVVTGTGCAIADSTKCECLLYSSADATPVSYAINVSIKDNVGNEFTDTWTITLDTNEVTSVIGSVNGTLLEGVWTMDYPCTATLCD